MPPSEYNKDGAGMQRTLSQTMCGALPTVNSAVTAVTETTDVHVTTSKHQRLFVPSG